MNTRDRQEDLDDQFDAMLRNGLDRLATHAPTSTPHAFDPDRVPITTLTTPGARRWTPHFVSAAAATILVVGLVALERRDDSERHTPVASPSATPPPEAPNATPPDTAYQSVLDLLPGESWVALAVSPNAQELSAYDMAGRRAWFSYVASPDETAPSDLDDDGTQIVRGQEFGDGVAVNCFLDTVDRVPCDTTELGLPALTGPDLAAAAVKLLPLLREGINGTLGDLVNPTAFTIDKVQAEELLSQTLGQGSAWLTIDPGVTSNMPIGDPLPLTAPDGSSVVSVVDRFGILYRVRTGPEIAVTDVLNAVPRLLGVASSGGVTPMTTLPHQQP